MESVGRKPIGRENAGDRYYRYWRQVLKTKVEGKGNGMKTIIVNLQAVAKDLQRPPEYLLKFFGCELGAITRSCNTTFIINGSHSQQCLEDILEDFIKKYVQCDQCTNPETTVKVHKGCIYLKCKACGHRSAADMTHKAVNYMLRNPPKEPFTRNRAEVATAKVPGRRHTSKPSPEAGGTSTPASNSAGEDDEVEWMTDTSAAAVAARAAEQLTQATAAMVTQGNIEAEREEARKKADKEAKKKAANRRSAAEAGEKLDEAGALAVLEEVQAEGGAAALQKLLPKMSVEGGLAVKVRCLYRALFSKLGPGLKLAGPLKEAVPLLKATASDARGQLAQLLALEWLLAVGAPDRVKEGALALKLLYDEDLEEEEIILEWANRKDAAKVLGVDAEGAKAVRAAVAPVVDWLQEAEAETESDAERG